jgi:hypothetical protein
MRLPRVRFTVRRMMVAVALIASVLGLLVWMDRRAREFRDRRDYHRTCWSAIDEGFDVEPAPAAYHRTMAEKYRRAAERSWLPIEPDPPEP